MSKWEYKWEKPGDISPEYMNRQGEHEWELAGTIGTDWVIFKRPVTPEMPGLLVVNNVDGAEFADLIDDIKDEFNRFMAERMER